MNVVQRIRRAWRLRQKAKYRRWLYDNRVILPRPKFDERSSIEQHRRIVTP